MPFGKPLSPAHVTSGWGVSRSYRGGTHQGLDFRAKVGVPLRAIEAGKVSRVVKVLDGNPGGKRVAIDHANGYTSKYMHMNRVSVRLGQQVQKGQLIGTSGNTGIERSQPHLHFELHHKDKAIPAEPYIPADSYEDDVLANAQKRGLTLHGPERTEGGVILALITAALMFV